MTSATAERYEEPQAPDTPGPDESGEGDDRQASAPAMQAISFEIDNEHYAVDILSVREIKAWTALTPLPNQPRHVRGVLNLRGAIVPIFDIRCLFGLGLTETTPTHVNIIVQVGERMVGILVDRVSDILSIESKQIRDLPDTSLHSGSDYLSGLLTFDDQMVALLHLPAILRGTGMTGPDTDDSAGSADAPSLNGVKS